MVASPAPGPRVVSLVPSASETLRAWGVDPVAVTRFCEQPDLPAVGGTKNPDVEAIVGLAPDLVVVCDEENRREDADALVAAGLAVHSCSPRRAGDVEGALADLAAAVGVSPDPDRRGGPVPWVAPLGLRAFVPIWRRPWMTVAADTYGASVLDAIGVGVWSPADGGGGADGGAGADGSDPGDRYPEVDLDDVVAAGVDVVLAPSEPYSFGPAHLDELARVAPVVEVDGQDLFWWGVRTPAAVRRLAAAISAATGGGAD